MIAGIKTLDDINVSGKVVLLRIDINSPVDSTTKKMKDDTRIRRSLPTIKELSEKKAKIVILAHQGDPLDYQNFTSLEEHSQILEKLLGKKVKFIDDVVGPTAQEAISRLKDGEILLLENIRLHTEETIIFEKEVKLSPREQAKTTLVKKLSPLADIYVCDAFACVHRSEPSLVGFPQLLPSACGRLFEEELKVLSQVREKPKRPCLFLLGGAKILDAFKMMEKVLENGSADKVLTGGLVGEIILKAAGYNLGSPSEELIRKKNLEEFISPAKKLLKGYETRLLYPQDVAVEGEEREEVDIAQLPVNRLIVDIGKKTVEKYTELIEQAQTIFMNGPVGIYEKGISSYGTEELWRGVARSSAFSVMGGGDTIAAARKFKVDDKISYICTAGGGMVRFLSGEKLPVLEALERRGRAIEAAGLDYSVIRKKPYLLKR